MVTHEQQTEKTALIVEDDKAVLQLIRLYLAQAGYRILEAQDGVAGLRMALEESPDIVLLDLNLPDARGEDVVRAIRTQMHLDTPIVVLSGEIVVDTVISLKPFNVSGFVAKSTDFEARLIEEVDKVFGTAGEISDDLPI